MKKMMIWAMTIMAMVMTGCTSADEVTSEEQVATTSPAGETVATTIRLTGDVCVTDGGLLRRSSNSDAVPSTYTSFLVYKIDQWGNTTFYAQGLFANAGEYTLKVEDGVKYRIRCTYVEELDDRLCMPLMEPFLDIETSQGVPGNTFYYGGNKVICMTNWCSVRLSDGTLRRNASVNYFYGEVEFYGGNSINIPMERHNIGLHFTIFPPEGGSVHVQSASSDMDLDIYSSAVYDTTRMYSSTSDLTSIQLTVTFIYADGHTDMRMVPVFRAENKRVYNIKIGTPGNSGNASGSDAGGSDASGSDGGNITLEMDSLLQNVDGPEVE